MNVVQKTWLGIGIVFIFLLLLNYYASNQEKEMNDEITKNRGEAIGIVIEYGASGKNISKDLFYKFVVNWLEYKGAIGVVKEKELEKLCKEQGYPDCVGAKFKVEYSTKNPKYSRIIIGNDTIVKNWGS